MPGSSPTATMPEARAWFAQGVRLVWAFDEVEAIRAFQQAQRLDPNCAMCFFGEAWARGPTINLQPRTEELAAARAAAQRAQALAANLSPRDRLLVEAMVVRTERRRCLSQRPPMPPSWRRRRSAIPGTTSLNIMAADARMITWDETTSRGRARWRSASWSGCWRATRTMAAPSIITSTSPTGSTASTWPCPMPSGSGGSRRRRATSSTCPRTPSTASAATRMRRG